MGFKDADCVWPGKKEHGSSFWISIKHNPGTHNAPSPSCAKAYTSESKDKPAPGLHLTPVAKALQAKAINCRRTVMLTQILFQTMQSLVSFLLVSFPMLPWEIQKTPLLSLERKSVCSLLSPLPPKKVKNGLQLWELKNQKSKRTDAHMITFKKSHHFSYPSLLFLGDLTHNFQKQTGSTADISKYFLSPPSHPPLLSFT